MPERDPEKVIEDLQDFRCDGDRERYWNQIGSSMDVEFESDTLAQVKHIYLGFVPGDDGKDKLTFELDTWEMKWDERSRLWLVNGWAPEETYFLVDFTKDRIPWKKVRALNCWTDDECAEIITMSPRFENELIEASAKMPIRKLRSAIADPILRKAWKTAEG